MNKRLLLILMLVVIPKLVYGWTDTVGSTTPASTAVRDVRDIFNDCYDETNSSHKVILSSSVSALEVNTSSPTAFVTSFQGAGEDYDVNISSPNEAITAYQGTGERWDVAFSSASGVEVFQNTHDNLNGNFNAQQGDADVGTANRLYVRFSSPTSGVTTYFGESLPTGSNIIGGVTQSGTWLSTETIKNFSTPAVTVSSSTATSLFAADPTRISFEVNLILSSYNIVVATYALTSTSEGWPIAAGTVWVPERRITNQLYGLAFTGDADVRIVEYTD